MKMREKRLQSGGLIIIRNEWVTTFSVVFNEVFNSK